VNSRGPTHAASPTRRRARLERDPKSRSLI
jgi:hypothetical protein